MLNPASLLDGAGVLFGLLIIGGIIFSESGMLVGFFMPGDTLLLTAGAFAAQGKLPLGWVIAVVAIAAIIGDNVGYIIGERYGRNMFKKKDGLLFRQEYLHRAEKFYERFGTKTMLLAHFVPIVRTFAPIVAGIGHMDRKRFIIYDAIGDTAWAVIVTLLGFWIGNKIPNIDHYFLLAVLIASAFTFSPLIWHLATDKKFHAKIRNRFTKHKTDTK
ncbi:MAG TPA: DedA family protein [Candidatus Saccharimonadales bacterium]|nr:DedA family protein [Candidatus Saccharimonadales bacterium]